MLMQQLRGKVTSVDFDTKPVESLIGDVHLHLDLCGPNTCWAHVTVQTDDPEVIFFIRNLARDLPKSSIDVVLVSCIITGIEKLGDKGDDDPMFLTADLYNIKFATLYPEDACPDDDTV